MVNPTPLPDYSHFPVMLEEVVKICSPKKRGLLLTVHLEDEDIQNF